MTKGIREGTFEKEGEKRKRQDAKEAKGRQEEKKKRRQDRKGNACREVDATIANEDDCGDGSGRKGVAERGGFEPPVELPLQRF
ncbi:MAG: hypothetical protein ACE5F1_15835, partial [Planctomycetota bacterium]